MNNKYYFPLILTCLGLSYQVQADEKSIQDKLTACNQAVDSGEPAKALEFAQQVLKQDQNNREAMLCKGRAHGQAGQFPQAIEAITAADRISATPYDHIIALTLLGNAHKSAKQYPEALTSYRKSLEIAQADKNKRFEHINLNLIGDTLLESNQPQAGLESYLAGSKLAANDNERADSFERIAAAHLTLKQYAPAIEYQVKAQMMQQKSGTLDQYANASLELGRMFTEAKDFPRAEKILNRIIQFSKDQGGAYYEAKGYYYLSQVKTATGDTAAAKVLLADAQKIATQIGAEDLLEEVRKAISK